MGHFADTSIKSRDITALFFVKSLRSNNLKLQVHEKKSKCSQDSSAP